MLSFPTVILACTLASFARAAVIQDHQASLNSTSFVTALCESSNLTEKIQPHDCYTAFLAFPFEKNGTRLKNKEPSLQSVSGTCNLTISTSDRHSFDVSAGRLLHGKGDEKNGGLEAILAQCHEEAGAIMIEGGTLRGGGNIKLSVNPAIGSDMSPYPGDQNSSYPSDGSSPYPASTFKNAQCAKAEGLKELDEEDCRTAFLDLPFDCDDAKLKVNTSSISSTENGCTVTITALASQTIEVSSGRLLDGVDGNGGIDALFKQCGDFPGSIIIDGGATHETNVKISIRSSKDELLSLQKRSFNNADIKSRKSNQIRGYNDQGPGPVVHLDTSGPFVDCTGTNLSAKINQVDCQNALGKLHFDQDGLKTDANSLSSVKNSCRVKLWTYDHTSLENLSEYNVLGMDQNHGLSGLFTTCGGLDGWITIADSEGKYGTFRLGVYFRSG